MNTLPEPTTPPWHQATVAVHEQVLRGDQANVAVAARFDVDLRQRTVTRGTEPREDTAAHAAGYAAGWAEGRRAVAAATREESERAAAAAARLAEETRARVEQAVTAMVDAAAQLEQRVLPTMAELELNIVAAAAAIAEAIVGRELTTATTPGLDAVARVLGLTPANRPVTVRLHPADLATLVETGATVASREVDGRTVTLRADRTLQPGDAVAECDVTTIEMRMDAALERVRKLLATGEEATS